MKQKSFILLFTLLFSSLAWSYTHFKFIDVDINEYLGDDSCEYGTFGCNKCVMDVEKSFIRRTPDRRKHRNKLKPVINRKKNPANGGSNPKFHIIKDHIQGMARVSGLGSENWFVMTTGTPKMGTAGFYMTSFPNINSSGEAIGKQPPRKRKTWGHYFHKIPDANHPGGMQTLGGLMIVASECSRNIKCHAKVDLIDVRYPPKPKTINTLVLDGSHGELVDDEGEKLKSKAASVAATRLKDGRLLLFIAGNQSGKYGWFFVSKDNKINSNTKWQYLDYWDSKENDSPLKWFWQGQDNVNFITECGTGKIYMLGLGTLANISALYRLNPPSIVHDKENTFSFTYIAQKTFNSTFLTTMRHGANIHVTPSGKLVYYLSSRWGKRVNEFSTKKR